MPAGEVKVEARQRARIWPGVTTEQLAAAVTNWIDSEKIARSLARRLQRKLGTHRGRQSKRDTGRDPSTHRVCPAVTPVLDRRVPARHREH